MQPPVPARFVVQSTEYCLASENVPCRNAMTMAAVRWRWPDRVGMTWTKTAVNSRMIVIADPVRQEPFQVPLYKWDQQIQTLPSDRPHQPLTEGVRFGRPNRRLLVFARHRSHSFIQVLREDAIPVMDQKPITDVPPSAPRYI